MISPGRSCFLVILLFLKISFFEGICFLCMCRLFVFLYPVGFLTGNLVRSLPVQLFICVKSIVVTLAEAVRPLVGCVIFPHLGLMAALLSFPAIVALSMNFSVRAFSGARLLCN